MLPALRALEFDRIVSVLAGLAVTPTGEARLMELQPLTEAKRVAAAQRATTEGVRFHTDHQGFPLRAPADLDAIVAGLGVEGRPLEPLRLIGLGDHLDSIDQSRIAVLRVASAFPLLTALVDAVASFAPESAAVRRAIDPSGDVLDHASPRLGSLRDRLRKQRSRLRTTLESFLRGRDTAKYLQDQVVTDRNGRFVLMVRAEHRSAIPGIIHGASASGASLFLEPLSTVEINNDIVAVEEEEAEEVHRILLALTDAFRLRPDELRHTIDIGAELDVIQAKARFARLVDGIEPALSDDGALELRGARHPLLMKTVWGRESVDGDDAVEELSSSTGSRPHSPVPVDILLTPPARILVMTGPNTGGKTVALKTAGLLAVMAQSGLHIPADHGSRLPVFRTLFADIGDEQSISASLSTFSAHITNVVSMDRDLALPALVLLDEVGAGTDPAEGGALGIAVIDHFRQRGAHLIATTHYDSLKSYASTTPQVVSAAFGFDTETFAPTYRLIYGSPGRSLAIEIARRLGMPADVIAAARQHLSEREQQLAEHLAKIDDDLRSLERERRLVAREREAQAVVEQRLRSREAEMAQREDTSRRRLHEQLDERLRGARREIDDVIGALKTHAAALTQEAARQAAGGRAARALSTGEAGLVRGEARAAVDGIVQRLKDGSSGEAPAVERESAVPVTAGARVMVGALGLEGTVVQLHGGHADVEVRGKRLRTALRDLRVIASAPGPAPRSEVRLNVDLVPRDVSPSDLNLVGLRVDDALTLAEKFLDAIMVSDHRTVRFIHGYGTGQLRRALGEFLKAHPLVARVEQAAQDQGGGGVTVAELKD